ncbi:hypothetical protein NEMIN01_1890, partial [Nematocida minor]|uniref:uncharacterized protein n=1 Tax=Nematocida minor TaxID=1912983 RepID=UPI00221E6980
MKEFIWTTCLNDGKGASLTLKKEEKDFIVREGDSRGLLNISDSSIDRILLLDDLPLVSEKLLKSGLENIKERVTLVLGRISAIESKEDRKTIHKVYSMHPFIYTKSVKNDDDSNDILILFDTHHKMHTFSIALTKKGKTTQDAAEILARYLHIQSHAIKYAGNKDKKAITTQRMSISGTSYLDIYKLSKTLHTAAKDANSSELLENSNNAERENENSSTPERNIFTSTRREVTNEDIKSEQIKIVRACDVMDEINAIFARMEKMKKPEQTDREYLEAAMRIEEGISIGSIERVEGGIKLGDLERNRFYLQ